MAGPPPDQKPPPGYWWDGEAWRPPHEQTPPIDDEVDEADDGDEVEPTQPATFEIREREVGIDSVDDETPSKTDDAAAARRGKLGCLAWVVGLAILATVCVSSSQEDEAPRRPVSSAGSSGSSGGAELSDTEVDRVAFLTVARASAPGMTAGESDAALVTLAREACRAIDNGASPETLVVLLLSEGATETNIRELGGIIGAGIPAFCPQHEGFFDR